MTEYIITKINAVPNPACSQILPADAPEGQKEALRQALVNCSNGKVSALSGLGKIKAANPSDTVNGYITIAHGSLEHIYTVGYYDVDEGPNSQHSVTFQKVAVIPSKAAVEALL